MRGVRSFGLVVALVVGLVVPWVPPAVPAGAVCGGVTFTGGAMSSFWDVAGNWSSGQVPDASDDVCIQRVGGVPVVVTVRTSASANSVTIEPNNGLTIQVEQSVAQVTATNYVANDGTITLTCANSGGVAALNANGALGIRNSGSGVINVFAGNCSGSLRSMTGNLTNDGAITVDKSMMLGAVANVGSTFTNNGIFNIVPGKTVGFMGAPLVFNQNGGSLVIGSPDGFTFSGTFRYAGGAIPANPPVLSGGAVLDFAAGSTVTPVEIIAANGSTTLVNDIPLGAVVRVQARPSGGASLNLGASYTNNGEIWLDSTSAGNIPTLGTPGSATLTNAITGIIRALAGGGGTRTIAANLANLGLISVTQTLNWTGSAGGSSAAGVVNDGTFAIGDGVATTLSSEVNFHQLRDLLVGDGATLTVSGPFSQFAGTLSLRGATSRLFLGPSGLALQGGVLSGPGTVNGNIVNSGGRVRPGSSPGVLTIAGNYTQGSNGALDIEIGGGTPGSGYDRLVIGQAATLDGALNVSLINGFTPAPTDRFVVMQFASRTGTFSAHNLTGPGAALMVAYSATDVMLGVAMSKLALPQVRGS
jgi:hypothetical protein